MQINFYDFFTGNRFLIWKSSYGDKFLFEKYEISFQVTLTPVHCSESLYDSELEFSLSDSVCEIAAIGTLNVLLL